MGRSGELLPSPLKVSSGSGGEADTRVSMVIASLIKMRKERRKLSHLFLDERNAAPRTILCGFLLFVCFWVFFFVGLF